MTSSSEHYQIDRAESSVEQRPTRGRRAAWYRRIPWTEYLWLSPALTFVVLFTLVPALYAIRMSFFEYSLATQERPFIGLDNYAALLDDESYWHSLRLSFIFAAIDVPLTIAIGLGIALLLNLKLMGRAIFRSILLLPWVISMVIAGYMLRWIFADTTGILNYLLNVIGAGEVAWLSSSWGAFTTILLSHSWKVYAFGMIILLAGLQSIPGELYEAAHVDGATAVQRLLHITIPLLLPQILILVILRTLQTFNMVDLVIAMTEGGPGDATELISYYMYQRAFEYFELGYASAIAVTILFLNIVLALVYIRVLRSRH